MIGTAPRSPTQEMKAFSLKSNFVGKRVRKMLIGRARKIKEAATSSPGVMIGGMRDGKTSKPSVKNMVICINHAAPSWKRITLRR
mgnify:CR=1 FL=1